MRNSRMPITSAATSMSRTAIQARPVELRTRFFAASASSATIVSVIMYFSTGVSNAMPKMCIVCAVMTPELEWFENHGKRTSAQTTKNCAASVATAR